MFTACQSASKTSSRLVSEYKQLLTTESHIALSHAWKRNKLSIEYCGALASNLSMNYKRLLQYISDLKGK